MSRALALGLLIAASTAQAGGMRRQRLAPGFVVLVDLVDARALMPIDREPGPAAVPSAEVERRARALLDADTPRWREAVDWFRGGTHPYRALRPLLARTAAEGQEPTALLEIANPCRTAPSDPDPVRVPAHAGLALVAPIGPLGQHADWLRRKLAIDFADAFLFAPRELRGKLRALLSVPDEEALSRAIDDEIGGTSFLGTLEAALAFADAPEVVERWAAAPLSGKGADLVRAIVGRVMRALQKGAAYPPEIYPAFARLDAPIAMRLIEWVTLAVPDGQWTSQRPALRQAADAYAARGGGSYLDVIGWSLNKSGRLR